MAAYNPWSGDGRTDWRYVPTFLHVGQPQPQTDPADVDDGGDGPEENDELDEDGNFPHDEEEEERSYWF